MALIARLRHNVHDYSVLSAYAGMGWRGRAPAAPPDDAGPTRTPRCRACDRFGSYSSFATRRPRCSLCLRKQKDRATRESGSFPIDSCCTGRTLSTEECASIGLLLSKKGRSHKGARRLNPHDQNPHDQAARPNPLPPISWETAAPSNQICNSASHFAMASVRGCSLPSKE
jgi:hypothetical protein